MTYKTIDVEVSLDEWTAEELANELRTRGWMCTELSPEKKGRGASWYASEIAMAPTVDRRVRLIEEFVEMFSTKNFFWDMGTRS